jgi:DNA (cytosine-5)-methyltransferase 1
MPPVADLSPTPTADAAKDRPFIAAREDATAVDCRNYKEIGDISGTLQAKTPAGHSLNYQNPVRTGYVIRRLTPTECERLMAFPDGYTEVGHDGKMMSDSTRYQMLGNSIVVNVLAYIMQNIAELLGGTAQ